jgi:hypothetical protein
MRGLNLILTLLLAGVFLANIAEADENDFLVRIIKSTPIMMPDEAASDCSATSTVINTYTYGEVTNYSDTGMCYWRCSSPPKAYSAHADTASSCLQLCAQYCGGPCYATW